MAAAGKIGGVVLTAGLLLSATLTLPAYDGEVIAFTMSDSQTYPGTTREIKLYVPEGFDGQTPACVLVAMDGIKDYIVEGMDKLISQGSMPVTIGVFVNPGYIKNTDGKVVRYNRSNEFDRADGRFAAFLENEVFAMAEQQKTSDGRSVALSKNAADRAIMGASSGAAAAFSAAWWRPDLFSRVYSIVGTYMPFRDADEYPWLIRKSEPKPIRIFLQDNDEDSWNLLFGSWFEENLRMFSALEFAGYEVDRQWDKGGHSSENGKAIFCRVMEWLWKGWPEKISRGDSNNMTLKEIIRPSMPDWELFKEDVGNARLVPYDDGEPLLVRNGVVTGLVSGGRKPSGLVRKYDPLEAVYPGGGQAVKGSMDDKWVKSYVIAENGKYLYGQDYYCLADKPYQLAFDIKGYLFAATDRGVQVCDHNGRVRVFLSLPSGPVTSIAFAGDRLYVVSGGDVYVRTVLTGGFTGRGVTPKRQGQG